MDIKNIVLGLVLFVVFWAFQAGYLSILGAFSWLAGLIIFIVILCLWCTGMASKDSDVMQLCTFVSVFALIVTILISFFGPTLGAVFPPGFEPSAFTPMMLSFWLVVFGGAVLITGIKKKDSIFSVIGLIWLFSAVHFVAALSTGPNSYLHFGVITGFSILVHGLVMKKGKAKIEKSS